MVKLIQASRVGDIREDNGCVIEKAAGRNRTRQRILDWSVRHAGAHPGLLTRNICGFRLLCK